MKTEWSHTIAAKFIAYHLRMNCAHSVWWKRHRSNAYIRFRDTFVHTFRTHSMRSFLPFVSFAPFCHPFMHTPSTVIDRHSNAYTVYGIRIPAQAQVIVRSMSYMFNNNNNNRCCHKFLKLFQLSTLDGGVYIVRVLYNLYMYSRTFLHTHGTRTAHTKVRMKRALVAERI